MDAQNWAAAAIESKSDEKEISRAIKVRHCANNLTVNCRAVLRKSPLFFLGSFRQEEGGRVPDTTVPDIAPFAQLDHRVKVQPFGATYVCILEGVRPLEQKGQRPACVHPVDFSFRPCFTIFCPPVRRGFSFIVAVEVRSEVRAHMALHCRDGLQGVRYAREQALRFLLPRENGVLPVQSRVEKSCLLRVF